MDQITDLSKHVISNQRQIFHANEKKMRRSYYARVIDMDLTIDAYEESGARSWDLRIAEQHVESLETVLDGQISYVWSQNFAVLIPPIRAEWHHEFLEPALGLALMLCSEIEFQPARS